MLVERGVIGHRHVDVAGRFDALSPVGHGEPSDDDRRPADHGEFLGDNGRRLEQTLGLIIDRRRDLERSTAILLRGVRRVCHHAERRDATSPRALATAFSGFRLPAMIAATCS